MAVFALGCALGAFAGGWIGASCRQILSWQLACLLHTFKGNLHPTCPSQAMQPVRQGNCRPVGHHASLLNAQPGWADMHGVMNTLMQGTPWRAGAQGPGASSPRRSASRWAFPCLRCGSRAYLCPHQAAPASPGSTPWPCWLWAAALAGAHVLSAAPVSAAAHILAPARACLDATQASVHLLSQLQK